MSEQHKTATSCRLNRDKQDFFNICEKLKYFSSFLEVNTLPNIFNSVVAHKNANVDKFFEVVYSLINKMEKKRCSEVFNQKKQ